MIRIRRRRGAALVVSGIATVASLTVLATGVATADEPDAMIHIDFKGTVTETVPASGASGGKNVTLSWEQTYDGPFTALYHGTARLAVFMHGVVSYGQFGAQAACTANLTLLPSEQTRGATIIPPGVSDSNYHLTLGRPSQPFVSDSTPGTRCSSNQTYEGSHFWDDQYYPAPGSSDGAAWEAVTDPTASFAPSQDRQTYKPKAFSKAPWTAESTVEFSGLAPGQAPPPSATPSPSPTFGPPAPPPLSPAVKKAALDAARQQLGPAIVSCLTLSAGAVVYGALGANPAAVVTGATMVAVAAPICAREVGAVRRLLDTYADPPVGSFTELAVVAAAKTPKLALPKCRRIASCETLQKRVKSWATAVQHTEDVAGALAVTAGRRTAAEAAGDLASTTAQAQHAVELLPALRTALKAQSKAEKPVASSLRRVGVRRTLSKKQKAKALALVRRRIARPAQRSALGSGPATRVVLKLLAG